jgi:hypothetical protein
VTTPTGNGDDAGDRRLTVAHLISVYSSLRYPQLTAVRDLGGKAWVSACRDPTPTGWWLRDPPGPGFVVDSKHEPPRRRDGHGRAVADPRILRRPNVLHIDTVFTAVHGVRRINIDQALESGVAR